MVSYAGDTHAMTHGTSNVFKLVQVWCQLLCPQERLGAPPFSLAAPSSTRNFGTSCCCGAYLPAASTVIARSIINDCGNHQCCHHRQLDRKFSTDRRTPPKPTDDPRLARSSCHEIFVPVTNGALHAATRSPDCFVCYRNAFERLGCFSWTTCCKVGMVLFGQSKVGLSHALATRTMSEAEHSERLRAGHSHVGDLSRGLASLCPRSSPSVPCERSRTDGGRRLFQEDANP